MARDDTTLSNEPDDNAEPVDLALSDTAELEPISADQAEADEQAADERAEAYQPEEEEEEGFEPGRRREFSFRGAMRGFGACVCSMIVHMIALLVLALMVMDDAIKAELTTIVASALEERPEDEPIEIELDERIETATEQTLSVISSAPALGAAGIASAVGTPTLDQKVVDQAEAGEVYIDAPTVGMLAPTKLIEAVPDGEVKGEPRDIVDDYAEAMDRITQEIMWMLDKGPVLVVWCFDQSESMKDDQKEIRDRIEHVYNQLGIFGRLSGDALLTAVVSYGEGFKVHTAKPTSNREEIRAAIDSVPVDPSGKEMMCQAVGQSIRMHRESMRRGRQMALILVTDESGERENNDKYLEAAIAEAKSANCKIYTLGREAVFGYPYAFIRWKHPQTDRIHWLRIDRGPETGFVEQLQTNGFHRRHDAFSSGFGPYEQARLSRETNGIFFMLPSVETNLVGAQKRRYEKEAMRPFRPDLRARVEVFADRDKYPLRTLIWKVVSDLNPYNPQSQKVVELQVEYPLEPPRFVQQARTNQQKAILLLKYMGDAEKALAEGRHLREQEADPRWQANYDVIFAQLVAYQARIYEYGRTLDEFIKTPKVVPLTKSPNLSLLEWDITTRKQALTEESKPYIERSTKLLEQVVESFPGTPWAERAKWELSRGFGVDVVPDYHPPYKHVENPIPVPNL